jgi:hypothetical protein
MKPPIGGFFAVPYRNERTIMIIMVILDVFACNIINSSILRRRLEHESREEKHF